MRVWLLQRNEPTPHDNEGEQRTFRTGIMASMLAEAGHDVVWWTSDFDHYNRCHRYNDNHREPVTRGYDVQYLQSPSYKKNISYGRISANKKVALNFAKVASKDPNKPNVIIASIPTAELAWQGIKYAQQHGIPVFLDVRDLWPDHIIALTPAWIKPFVKLAMLPLSRLTTKVFNQATGVFGLTEPFLDWGLSYAKRERNSCDRVVPMGYIKSGDIEADQLNEGGRFWDELSITEHSGYLIVSFIGTIGRSSNLDVVVEAAKKLEAENKKIKLVICGDGELAGSLHKKTKGLGNVIMPGWINNGQIKSLLMRSDVGLLPYIQSENYFKNLPNKPAEYLSEGLLLASSLPRGPLYTLIEKFDCGFSYLGDAECLTQKLSFYNDHPKQMEKGKENALEVFNRQLNGEVIYRDMIEFLRNIVTKSNGIN